ncbi:MAG: hypothetical protein A2V88_08205 [Elusimicrobia bacterium RBG_16_66_12]|nr:MAG: hypothetical protein A2V88_08205 [Elusimicrobia bacterium RBG_16_66_12]
MKTPSLLAVILSLAVSSPALAAHSADFDAGVDASAVLKAAKESAKKDKTAVATYYPGGRRTIPDCVAFTFSPTDNPVSESVYLRSTEYVTECQPVGDPRHGGGQNCWERPGYSYSQRVQVTLRDRQPLLPWEHDVFRVCLDGPWLYTNVIEAAYDYKLVSAGADSGRIVLSPTRKIPMRPDPVGVLADLSGQFVLNFKDKWSSYYPGENIVLKIALTKEVKFWPDYAILTKEITVPVAEAYRFDLNKFAAEFSEKPAAGKDYYVAYSIKRTGKVSKNDFTKALETSRVSYAPASLAFNK